MEIQWTHPTHGEIFETVCAKHEQQLYRSLQFLGIGYSGRPSNLTVCTRCQYVGYESRSWIGNCRGS